MTNYPHDRDPRDPVGIDPLDPAAPHTDARGAYEPREHHVTHVDTRRGGGRAGLAIAAVLAALLVIGFIAFTGPGVDPETTATAPGDTQQEELVPSAPGAEAPAAAPEAAPAMDEEAPAATEQPAPAPAPAQ